MVEEQGPAPESAEETKPSIADEVFSEFLVRVQRGESLDPEPMLARIAEPALRDQLRLLIENYQHRVLPRTGSEVRMQGAPLVGRFQILGELGRGGMGIVYLAQEKALNRKVALKVLPKSEAQDERVLNRFLREAEAAARLRHPNIVPIYLAGEHEGTYYYSMEYVPGITLAELIRALRAQRLSHHGPLTVRRIEESGEQALRLVQRMPGDPGSGKIEPGQRSPDGVTVLSFTAGNYVREALKLFAGVAEALEYAHREGKIVHRDIKPSNLLLASDGRLMIADFGLAKIGGAQSITRTGEFMGSPGYMSPEQAMARRIPIDHRTDVWSLGVTLYEFLTLQHPFQSDTIELTLKRIITHEPRPPRLLNPRLPKDVETIVLKALEKNPDHRYASAGEFAADLHCVLRYESIQAKSHGPITRSIRFVRRNVAKFAVGLLAVALATLGGWAFTALRDREHREVERHFQWVRSRLVDSQHPLLDEETIVSIQDVLRRSSATTEGLAAAIDQLGMRTTEEVRREIENPAQPGSLLSAMRALAKVQAIYFHNPNTIERERLERIDRATSDQRIQIIRRIADRLRAEGKDGGAPAAHETEQLWEWLCMFLGTRPMIAGVEAKNPLVRINALNAMSTLPANRSGFHTELRRVLNEPSLDPQVMNEAVAALAFLPDAGQDKEVLDSLAFLIQGERRAKLPFSVRYRIAQTIQTSPLRKQYKGALMVLQNDEELPIQRLAKEALKQIAGT